MLKFTYIIHSEEMHNMDGNVGSLSQTFKLIFHTVLFQTKEIKHNHIRIYYWFQIKTNLSHMGYLVFHKYSSKKEQFLYV